MSNEQFLTSRPLPGARLNMAHPLTKGLVGCWLLNEQSGMRAMDLSPYENHGSLSGFASPIRRPFNGLPFDGSSEIDLGSPYKINIVDAPLTIISWIKHPGIVGTYIIIGRLNGYGLYFTATDVLRFGKIGVDEIVGADSVSANVWHQVGMVYSVDDKVNFYIDAVADSGNPVAYNTTFNTGLTYYVGSRGAAGYLTGSLGGVWVWNRALIKGDLDWHYAEPYDMFLR